MLITFSHVFLLKLNIYLKFRVLLVKVVPKKELKERSQSMPSYAVPLSTAFFVFGIIAFLGTTPWTIYQYRKHGYFSFWRNLIIFSFIYYGLTALFLVSLPLPAERNNAIVFKDNVYTQLRPFNMFHNFREVAGFNPKAISTYPILLKSFTFLEVAFNMALLFPLGVYLRYFLKTAKKWWLALLLVFSTTLFFEVSQLTALFGYYAHPYRLFDVDDLLTNTLGGMLGFFIAPILLNLIPSRDELKERDKLYDVNQLASYGSQLIEVFISVTIAQLIGGILTIIIGKNQWGFWINTGVVFFFLVIFPLLTKGKTLGGKVVKIKFDLTGKQDIFSLSYRFFLIYFPTLLSRLTAVINQKESIGVPIVSLQVMLFLGTMGIWFVFWLLIIRDWIKKRREPFFNRSLSVKMIRYKK